MNNYEYWEKIGYDYLVDILHTKSNNVQSKATPLYHHFDAWVRYPITYPNGNPYKISDKQQYIHHIYEIKIRHIASTVYNTSYMELDKYESVMDEYRRTGHVPHYLVLYPDGVYIDYNLLDVHILDLSRTAMNQQTVWSTSEKKDKTVINLPIYPEQLHTYNKTHITP